MNVIVVLLCRLTHKFVVVYISKALLQGRPLSPDEALERAHRLDRLYELRRALEESRQQRLRQQGGTPPGQQPSTAVALQRPPPLRTTPSRQTMVSTFTALDGRHMRGMSTLDSTPTRTTVQDANDSVAGGLSRGPDLDSYLAHMSQEVAAQQRALYESRQAQRTVEARVRTWARAQLFLLCTDSKEGVRACV